MKRLHKTLMAGLVVMGVIALLAGPSLAAEEKTIKIPIGLNLELTGGIAASTIPQSYAFLDYFTWINDQGGFTFKNPVDGKMYRAMYDILWADNGFSVARSVTNVKRFADRGAKVILTA